MAIRSSGIIEGPVTKYFHMYNNGKDFVGRCSLDITQNAELNKLLPKQIQETRRYGLEFWKGRDRNDESTWNYEIYLRKTFTDYMFLITDRVFDTLPEKFKYIWENEKIFIIRVCYTIFKDPDTEEKFCYKGKDLGINWSADCDKIKNNGPEGWFYKLAEDSMRAAQNYMYWCIATLDHIGREYLSRFNLSNDYELTDGTIMKLTTLHLVLLAMDSFNLEISRIAKTLPAIAQHGYLNNVKFSIDFKDELIATHGANAEDYFNNVVPVFFKSGFVI